MITDLRSVVGMARFTSYSNVGCLKSRGAANCLFLEVLREVFLGSASILSLNSAIDDLHSIYARQLYSEK